MTAWLFFLAAAILEVGGDATIRAGLRNEQWLKVLLGLLILASYGLVVNQVRWDFSRLLGVYVAVFALVSVLFGRLFFNESIAASTWIGLSLILIGGLTIQFGRRF